MEMLHITFARNVQLLTRRIFFVFISQFVTNVWELRIKCLNNNQIVRKCPAQTFSPVFSCLINSPNKNKIFMKYLNFAFLSINFLFYYQHCFNTQNFQNISSPLNTILHTFFHSSQLSFLQNKIVPFFHETYFFYTSPSSTFKHS